MADKVTTGLFSAKNSKISKYLKFMAQVTAVREKFGKLIDGNAKI